VRGLLTIAVVFVPTFAAAQQCVDATPPTLVNDNHSSRGYEFTGVGYDCNDAESFFHFVGSRGAYANAFTAVSRYSTDQLQNTCNLLDLSGAPASSCLKYSGDCSAAGVGPLCVNDSQAKQGEISCNCQVVLPQMLQSVRGRAGFPPIGLGTDHGFFARLLTDKDVDGKADEEASDRTINNIQTTPFRVRELARGLWRMEWEDLFPNDTADYNDYVNTYELQECRPDRWPLDSETIPPTCLDECGDDRNSGACVEGIGSTLAANLRFRANISVEQSFHATERVDFENEGRRLQVSLTLHSTMTSQGLIDLLSTGDVAICPVVSFLAKDSISQKRHRVALHYGGTCGHGKPAQFSGQPICDQSSALGWDEKDYLLVGLGRTFLTSDPAATFDNSCDVSDRRGCTSNSPQICNSRPTPDLLSPTALTPPTACNGNGTNNLNLWFEAPVKDIEAGVGSRSFSVEDYPRTTASWIDVLVFHDIKAPDFACPTGVDIVFDGVDPAVAKVQRYRLWRNSLGFSDQLIYR
jgi:hypothetical protein